MTATGTARAIAGATRPLGRVAGQDAKGDRLAARLAEALGELKALAACQKAAGSDALAAYMLGRASQWPKAWLRRQVAADAREFAEVGYDFDGVGR